MRLGYPRYVLVAFATTFITSAANAGPIYSVDSSGINNTCGNSEALGSFTSSSPGVSLYKDVPFDHFSSNHYLWEAEAGKTTLSAQSAARVSGPVPGLLACTRSVAEFAYDDVTFFDAVNSTTTVSVDIHYKGTLHANDFGGDGTGIAEVLNKLVLKGHGLPVNGIAASGTSGLNTSGYLYRVFPTDTDSSVTVDIDTVLTHTWYGVPTNTALSLEVGLATEALSRQNFGQGSFVDVNFLDGMSFAKTCDIFTLEAGVTAQSDQLGLSSCSTTVPTPPSLPLLVAGLIGVWWRQTRPPQIR